MERSQLKYEKIGAGEPFLFMHGLGADRRQTVSAFRSLDGVCVIAPDFPGHGGSHLNENDISFDSFSNLIIDLLDSLNMDSLHLGGLSMGSGVALNLALRFPERVKSLVLLRPSWLNTPCPVHLELVAKVGRWIEEYGVEAAHERLTDDLEFQKLNNANYLVAKGIEALLQRPQAVAGAKVLDGMWKSRPFNDLESLRSISQPSLVLQSPEDDLHPGQVADTIAKHLVETLEHSLPARYRLPVQYEEQLVSTVRNFLKTQGLVFQGKSKI